ncbi:hypothetical protein LJB86_01245 [Deltaproteobacteria bacterium OttesenSCG-928-M10]|nr:hypothetical protein [Deltaproteobacteria bacterium OttesenSCG-928-M10]
MDFGHKKSQAFCLAVLESEYKPLPRARRPAKKEKQKKRQQPERVAGGDRVQGYGLGLVLHVAFNLVMN